MLSITADHALRAVLLLARIPSDHAMRADAIAEAIGAPRNYLAKTLNALAKSGIVRSSRGPFGGFSLAVSPLELTVARVTQLFDERRRTGHCLLSKARCDADNPCAAHGRWTAITASALQAIETTTIADLLGEGTPTPADMAPSHARPWMNGRRKPVTNGAAHPATENTLRAS
ncbi:MAG: Rrf2 family transcriptional regulator [Gemmatimonadaceae bacterium]|jgi:Rrf2 family protein|nr:Rrf2 family transcriptional regulator [Gemmatimonadaceae bacterium]MCC6432839.1 Rrf2 family transcriptional regulator [Gemmatimonadaceae bacterium]